MKKIVIILLIFFIFHYQKALSQNFNVSEIDPTNYPKVVANFSAFNAFGAPYNNLNSNDFEVRENGILIPPQLVEIFCRTDAPYNVVLVIDKSSSMLEKVDGQILWDWAKEGALSFINNIPIGDSSRIALVTFSGKAELMCPFTNNKQEFIDSLNKVPYIYGNTNFNVAFLNKDYGAINLLKNQSPYFKRAIVFLSDGEHSTTTEPLRYDEILSKLQEYNIQLFAITILSKKSSDLENMAKRTGGYYDFVTTKSQLNDLYKAFASSIQQRQQCLLQWTSPDICDDKGTYRQAAIRFKILNKTVVQNYRAPNSSIVFIETDKNLYDFGNPELGEYIDRDIVITPRLRSFNTQDIRIIPSQFFEIIDWGNGIGNPPSYNFVMPVDVPRTLKVRFKPSVAKKFRTASLIIDGEPCPKEIPLVGGYQQIKLITPKEGDFLSACDSITIRWQGQDPNSTVDISYSIDNGENWNLIAKNIKGNSYKWLAPDTSSYFRIKVETSTSYEYEFIKSFGDVNDDFVTSINVNQNGLYFYVAGYFNNSTDIAGKKLTSKGKEDFFLAKFDNEGNVIWAKSGGSIEFNDRIYGITSDHQGYVYVTGVTYKGVNFDNSLPILPLENTPYLFVAKYNSMGNYVNSYFLGAVNDFKDFKAEGTKIKFEYNIGQLPKLYVEGLYSGQYYDYSFLVDFPLTGIKKPFTCVFNTNLELTNIYAATLPIKNYSSLDFNYAGETQYRARNFTGTTKVDKTELVSKGLNDFWIYKYGKIPSSFDVSGSFSIVRQYPSLIVNNYNFGNVIYGDSVEIVLDKNLYNNFKVPIYITSFSIDAIGGSDMKNDYELLTDLIGTTLYSGDSIDLKIKFKPNYTGPRNAWIDIYSSCANPIRINLTGNGVCGGKVYDIYDFGEQNINKPRKDTIFCAYKNISNSKIVIQPLIRGGDFTEFFLEVPSYHNVYNGKITVNPGQCIDLIVTFNPKTIGDKISNINFFVEAPCVNSLTQLRGAGISADIRVSNFDWKKRRINGRYSGEIVIKNNSTGKEILDKIEFENNEFDDIFSYIFDTNSLPLTLNPESEVRIPIFFEPKEEKGYSKNILIYINSIAQPLKSKIEGIGYLPKLEISWECGERIRVGETSEAILLLKNPSQSSSLIIREIDFEQIKQEFEWKDGVKPQNLEINENSSISIPVIFKPTNNSDNKNKILVYADNYDGTFKDEWKVNDFDISCDAYKLNYTNPLNFGNNIICSNNELFLKIKNESTVYNIELYLSQAQLIDNEDNVFKFNYTNSLLLNGKEETTLKVFFEPKLLKTYKSKLIIPNSANIPIEIELMGSGFRNEFSTNEKNVKIDVASKLELPIFIKIPKLENGFISELDLKIKFNPIVINFLENSFNSKLSNWNWNNIQYIGNGILSIKGSGKINDNQTIELFKISFIGLLNDIHKTEININSNYGCSIYEDNLTLIEVNKVCFNDGRILITNQKGTFVLKEISPNPISSSFINLEYGVGFDVFTNISLINSYGNIEKLIMNDFIQAGYYNQSIDIKDLSSGLYYLHISAGPFSDTKKIIIIK